MKQAKKKIAAYTLVNLIFLVVVLFCISCKPEMKGIREITFKGRNGDTVFVDVSYDVYNPNVFTIGGEDVSVKIMDKRLFIGSGMIEPFSIEPKTTTTVRASLGIIAGTLQKLYEDSRDSIPVKAFLSGDLKPVPVVKNVSSEVMIDKKEINSLLFGAFFNENDLKFDSLQYSVRSPLSSSISFRINLRNSFDFDYTIKKIKAKILPSKNSSVVIASWRSDEEVTLASKAPFYMPCDMEIDHLSLLRAGAEKRGGSLNSAWIDGTTTVELNESSIITIPFGFEIKLNGSNVEIVGQKK